MRPRTRNDMKSTTGLRWSRTLVVALTLLLTACDKAPEKPEHGAEPVIEKGEHNGRLLKDKDFTLELAIFETGVPPEYRAWSYFNGKPVQPGEVKLQVRLTR